MMIRIKRFYQLNEKYFDLVNRNNPLGHITQISQNKSIFKIGDEILNIDDSGSKATIEHNGKIVATCLYDLTGKKIDIVSIASQVKGEGYAKMLMLYLIKKFGYENIERTILTSDGSKMFSELDEFLDFDYIKYIQSETVHVNKKLLVEDLAKSKPLLSVFLDNMCNYGKDFALQTFKDEIKNGKLENYPIYKIIQLSEWVDGSIENKNENKVLPEYIKLIVEEIKKL